MHWLANGLHALTLGGLLAWTFFFGIVCAGAPLTLPVTLIFFLLPFALVGLTVTLLIDQRLFKKTHIAVLAIGLIALVPLYKQPWNPRHQFVANVLGIQDGATETQVRKLMNGYLGGAKHDEVGTVPDDPAQKSFSQIIYYRWNDDDGNYNADLGIIYLKDGKVVGTKFSPD